MKVRVYTVKIPYKLGCFYGTALKCSALALLYTLNQNYMATLKNGILGGFSGKAGTVIGYQSRGQDRIRAVSKHPPKKPTQRQRESRAKFKVLNDWRNGLFDFFTLTFINHTHEHSAQNAAHRHNVGIINGEYPNYEIDYSKVIISSGNLPSLKDAEMMVDENKKLHITWKSIINSGAKHGDLVALLICYDKPNYYQESTAAAYRMNDEVYFQLQYPPEMTFAHVYITVISDDRQRAANSNYLGKINLEDLSIIK
jgi:hypothetical protein